MLEGERISCRCVDTTSAEQLITLTLLPVCKMCVRVFQQEKLLSLTRESTELSNDISNRKQMLAKIEEEVQQAEEVCDSFKNLFKESYYAFPSFLTFKCCYNVC